MFVTKKQFEKTQEDLTSKMFDLEQELYNLKKTNNVLVKAFGVQVGSWVLGKKEKVTKWEQLLDYLNIEYKKQEGFIKKK